MHRSRLSALAIFAAAAACSTPHDSDTKALSQDPALVATLEVRQQAQQPPLPDACVATTVAAQPGVANKPQAEKLARQGYHAELLGNTTEARSLLRRASELDGTDKSAAYHLGRTSEALGDRDGAMTAYCRYLALTPTTAESVEARQRVAELSQSETRTAAGSVGKTLPLHRVAAATARRATRVQPTVAPRVASRASVEQSARARSPERGTHSASAVTGGADDSSAPGDVMITSTASPTESRGPSRAQGAGIGAVAGALIGAATGRSLKSAVIGAAAGGILGTVVGGGIGAVGRGMRPWATGAQQAAGARSGRLPNRNVPAA